jgi:hypothetical protein
MVTGKAAAPRRDWKNPDAYRFTEDLDALGWAWQFLWRNDSYRQQCESYLSDAAARGETLPWFGPYFLRGEFGGQVVLSDVGELPILDTGIELPDSEAIRLAFAGWLGEVRHLPEFDDYSPRTWTQRMSGPGKLGEADRGWGRGPFVGTFRVFLEFDLAPQFAWIQESILNFQALYAVGTRGRPEGIVGGRLKIRRLKWGISSKSGNRGRFKRFLRILDGTASRATPQQIGEVVFADRLKGLPPRPPKRARHNLDDKQAWQDRLKKLSQSVQDDLETARQLSCEPWVILFSNPPRKRWRQRIRQFE